MRLDSIMFTSGRLWKALVRYVMASPERKWTVWGIAIAFGISVVAVPPLGIAAFGTAIAGWWLVALVLTIVGGFAGNRWGIQVDRNRAKKPVE